MNLPFGGKVKVLEKSKVFDKLIFQNMNSIYIQDRFVPDYADSSK